jgi:hypothetical protein
MSTVFVWTNDDGSIDACELDIYETETHAMTSEISKFPVEKGVDVTDNIRRVPRTLVLEGYVSDSPAPLGNMAGKYGGSFQTQTISAPDSPQYKAKTVKLDIPGTNLQPNVGSLVTAGFGALASALGFGPSNEVTVLMRAPDKPPIQQTVQVWTWDHWESHAAEAFRLLKKAWLTGVLVQVITDLETYSNMAVTSVTVPRKVEDGAGAPFSVNLEEIQIVSTKTVDAPKPAEPLGQTKKSTAKSGTTDPKEVQKQQKTALRAAALGLGANA